MLNMKRPVRLAATPYHTATSWTLWVSGLKSRIGRRTSDRRHEAARVKDEPCHEHATQTRRGARENDTNGVESSSSQEYPTVTRGKGSLMISLNTSTRNPTSGVIARIARNISSHGVTILRTQQRRKEIQQGKGGDGRREDREGEGEVGEGRDQ